MNSAGNDIVALNAINLTRAKQEKFYLKILSPAEKELYGQPGFNAIPFEHFVWLLWSVKESAFKYLQRLNPGLVFTPVKFEVKQMQIPAGYKTLNFAGGEITGAGFHGGSALKGIISVGDYALHSHSLIYHKLIMSAVNRDYDFGHMYWGIKSIDNPQPAEQSLAVREFILKRLAGLLGGSSVAISKNQHGIPVLLSGGQEIPIPVSLSHHENFAAYAFWYPGA